MCHAMPVVVGFLRELLIKQLMKQVSKACLVLKVGVRVVWKHLSKGEEVREKGKVG